jgi:hypothetical protein
MAVTAVVATWVGYGGNLSVVALSVMPGVVVVHLPLGLVSMVVLAQPHPLLVLRSSMVLVVQV